MANYIRLFKNLAVFAVVLMCCSDGSQWDSGGGKSGKHGSRRASNRKRGVSMEEVRRRKAELRKNQETKEEFTNRIKATVESDPNAAKSPDDRGNFLIHKAVHKDAIDAVSFLLDNGADVDAQNTSKVTPLNWAAGRGNLKIAELLIQRGAQVDTQDVRGVTPLRAAAFRGHKDLVELLLANGADPNLKDGKGRTPLDVAKMKRHPDVVAVLEAVPTVKS